MRAVLSWKTGEWHASHTLKLTIDKMVETLFLALMATTMAVLFAVPLSFLGARNLMTRHLPGTAVYYCVRTGFNLMRSIEPLIMAILFAVWVGIGPFAGMLALGVHSSHVGETFFRANRKRGHRTTGSNNCDWRNSPPGGIVWSCSADHSAIPCTDFLPLGYQCENVHHHRFCWRRWNRLPATAMDQSAQI